jgi:hypothetical protein
MFQCLPGIAPLIKRKSVGSRGFDFPFAFGYLKRIKSDGYGVTACDQFCILTFGMEKQPWVSMTVVPTHDDPDSVEIMSVNFLSDAEKAELGLTFDEDGRVI